METLILSTLALTAVALVVSLRRRNDTMVPAAAAQAPIAAAAHGAMPSRIANPRNAKRPDVKVWTLVASPACELTREFMHGRRYRTEDAVALPAVGCNLSDCRCRYEPVSDTRRRERRHAANRRNAIRFEAGTDRRAGGDRRQNDIWQHGSLR
jgi:hypothetical protein